MTSNTQVNICVNPKVLSTIISDRFIGIPYRNSTRYDPTCYFVSMWTVFTACTMHDTQFDLSVSHAENIILLTCL